MALNGEGLQPFWRPRQEEAARGNRAAANGAEGASKSNGVTVGTVFTALMCHKAFKRPGGPVEGLEKRQRVEEGAAVRNAAPSKKDDRVELSEEEWPYYQLVHNASVRTLDGFGKGPYTQLGDPAMCSILLLLKVCRPLRLKDPGAWQRCEKASLAFNKADQHLRNVSIESTRQAVDLLDVLVPYQVALRQIVRGEEEAVDAAA